MSRRLWLLRHAKSAWDTGTPDDFDRPLAKRGHKDAPRMGRWLAGRGGRPDYVVSSPARRARETTLAVCEPLGVRKKSIYWDTRIYEAELEDLLAVLADCPAITTTLLVGHNPGLDELLLHLAGEAARPNAKGKLMTTAAAASLVMPDDWGELAPGCARLEWLQRPRELEA